MSDTTESSAAATDQPITEIPGDLVELEMMPSVGWVVHEVEGKPQQTSNMPHWAWCRVSTEGPGYTDIVFTEADGITVADPYRKPTPSSLDYPVRLGRVLFKVFC